MTFVANLKLKSRAARLSRCALVLGLLLCLCVAAWAQEAPRPEGSSRIKPPLIKPPMTKSQVKGGSVRSRSRRRKATRRKRRVKKAAVRHEIVMTPAEGEQPNAEPPVAGGTVLGGASGPPAIKPPMANEGNAPLNTSPAPRAPITGGVLNGKAVMLPRPLYPPIARAARAAGTVVVQITVDEEGNVISARAVSGHPLLQSSAVEAARQAKFTPTMLGGVPVKVTGTLSYRFVLPPQPPPGNREGAHR